MNSSWKHHTILFAGFECSKMYRISFCFKDLSRLLKKETTKYIDNFIKHFFSFFFVLEALRPNARIVGITSVVKSHISSYSMCLILVLFTIMWLLWRWRRWWWHSWSVVITEINIEKILMNTQTKITVFCMFEHVFLLQHTDALRWLW